ncbi:hypothetical protein ALC56_09992 [Trachymyrmex septentrionalis]|uniref:Uncharacterized protein n=1 Tax=Trachymyrmex septentrionalis TaxID=34720 RepID=A0A151JUD3_9HYME|nr:hypothetical protein ALC56_09992 [Trachymyrmex septentrionalis]
MLRLMHATYPCNREIAALTSAIGKVKCTIKLYRLIPATMLKIETALKELQGKCIIDWPI